MPYIIGGLVLLILLFIIEVIREENALTTTAYEIQTDKIKKPKKLVILADLHNKELDAANHTIIEKINAYQPDIILVAGDMITKRQNAYESAGHNLLLSLSKHYPIYYVYGNHEQGKSFEEETDFSDYIASLKGHGVQFVNNTSVQISDDMFVSGMVLPMECYRRFDRVDVSKEEIKGLLDSSRKEGYHILLCHTPAYMKDYMVHRPDLVISGHYHGGMVRLPILGGIITPQFRLFPKYNGGKYHFEQTDIIVSRGLGNHKIKMRFLNCPELIFVELKNR